MANNALIGGLRQTRTRSGFVAATLLLILTTACSGTQSADGGTTPTGGSTDDGDELDATGSGEDGAEGSVEDTAARHPACIAYERDEMDQLRRWVPVFPIRRGGAVLVFVGTEALQMDVEASLEMAGIMGYEDHVCGTAVIVWVPGMECHGDHEALATRVEEGTTMVLGEDPICFRIDEVRLRLAEECERGTVTGDACP